MELCALGRAAGAQGPGRGQRRGGGISRNQRGGTGPPAEEVGGVRGPRGHLPPGARGGAGVRAVGPVGSGRGLELGGGLDARARGWAGRGAGPGTPGAEPGRREVTAGALQPRVTQPPRGPKLRAREVCGDGRGSRAGSGGGPRGGRKWGTAVPGDPVLRGRRGRDGAPLGGGAGRRGWAGTGWDRTGRAAPPPALCAALAERTHTCAPCALAGPWVPGPALPPARPPGPRREGPPR